MSKCVATLRDEGVWPPELTTLGELRPGALFCIRNGTEAIKTAYRDKQTGKCVCILLGSGEYANFTQSDDMQVQEIILDDREMVIR